jgi:TonB-dependent receptor
MADFAPTTLPNFYPGNIYSMGPVPAIGSLLSGLNINSSTMYAGPMVETDPVADKGQDWDSYETVYAGYAMYSITSGKMTVMGGARIEGTHIKYDWNQAYNDVAEDVELPAPIAQTGTIDYVNVLPSLGMKYVFSDTFTTRINYSETIARPTYNEYIPSPTLGQNQNGSFSSADPVVTNTYGNPNLKPMVSDNIDSSWEFYPQKGAILAVDGFIKDISNYFAPNYNQNTSGSAGVTNTVTYENIPYSQIYGLEFQYQQQYTMLPGFLSGLGFRGSISRMWSQGETSPGNYTELPSQSDLIFNTGIFYKKSGLTIDIGGSFTGANLSLIGNAALPGSEGGPVPNVYYDDYFQIDAKIQYAFTKDFTIYAEGDNLNNEPLRYYQGSSNLPIQNEYYGPTFDGGAKVDF